MAPKRLVASVLQVKVGRRAGAWRLLRRCHFGDMVVMLLLVRGIAEVCGRQHVQCSRLGAAFVVVLAVDVTVAELNISAGARVRCAAMRTAVINAVHCRQRHDQP